MSPAHRLTALFGRNRPAGPEATDATGSLTARTASRATRRPKLPRAGDLAPRNASDLAARLTRSQRALRGRLEHRDLLIEVVRGVNALEPARIADFIVN